jgi:hypothetical protein
LLHFAAARDGSEHHPQGGQEDCDFVPHLKHSFFLRLYLKTSLASTLEMQTQSERTSGDLPV